MGPGPPEHPGRKRPPGHRIRLGWRRFDARWRHFLDSTGRHRETGGRPEDRPLPHRRHGTCPGAVRRPPGHGAVTTSTAERRLDLTMRSGLHDTPVIEPPHGLIAPVEALCASGPSARTSPDAGPTDTGPTEPEPSDQGPRTSPSARPRRTRRRHLVPVAVVVAVIGLGVTAVTTSSAVRRQLLLSFTRQPDDFAELYFPSPSALPTSFIPGQPLLVHFGLTNDSDSTRTFGYVVVVGARNGHTAVEQSGTLRVMANQAVVEPLRVPLARGTTSLSVRLTGQPVEIRLLLHQGAAHAG